MAELVEELGRLPNGAHCVSLYSSREEAADHAAAFLSGTPAEKTAAFWVSDSALLPLYVERVEHHATGQVGCVRLLQGGQVEPRNGHLRPVDEVAGFLAAHPEGVCAGADTIPEHWAPASVDDHLQYEQWFDAQPRDSSRFLCPYDLRRVPGPHALHVLRRLGAQHSHVRHSASGEPAARLLQLFVFPTPASLPEPTRPIFRWAIDAGYVRAGGPEQPFELTPSGRELVDRWARETTLDWYGPGAAAPGHGRSQSSSARSPYDRTELSVSQARSSPPRRPARTRPGAPAPPTQAALIEIRFKGTSVARWIQELNSRWNASVRLHVCRPLGTGKHRILRLFEVDAPPEEMGAVWEYLLRQVGAENAAVTRIAPNRLMVWTSAPIPRLCAAVFEADAVCTACPYLPPTSRSDPESWGILLPHASNAQLPLDAMTRPGRPPPAVLRIGRYEADETLTPRQERALDEALRLGYFSHPRRAELKDVARALGVSRSTAMEILRRAMMKLAAQRSPARVATSGLA